MDIKCDCLKPLQGVNPDDDCGNICSRCGCEVAENDNEEANKLKQSVDLDINRELNPAN